LENCFVEITSIASLASLLNVFGHDLEILDVVVAKIFSTILVFPLGLKLCVP